MILYLVHHGDAVPPEVDPQRPLSTLGKTAVRRAAVDAAARGAKPTAVWHSGKLRARQTAEVFWRECNPLAECSAVRGLQPTDPPEWMHDRVTLETRDLMLVGHMPNLERVLRLLLAGDPERAEQAFPLHGVVALQQPGTGTWQVQWRIEGVAAGQP